jgi:hypothetical protein
MWKLYSVNIDLIDVLGYLKILRVHQQADLFFFYVLPYSLL